MTDEEVEVVAEELAKAGGVAWYPGREQGTMMRVVSDRYRDRARAAIEALDRFRESNQSPLFQDNGPDETVSAPLPSLTTTGEAIRPGITVIYRPPGDRRAYSCRVVELEGSRAYLAPILRACTNWVSIEHLTPAMAEQGEALLQE